MAVVGLIALLAASSGAAFPAEPLPNELEAGRQIARSFHGRSLSDLFKSPAPRASSSRIWGSDKQAIGWWSNGYQKTPVEFAVWLSPELVSRWLGLLAGREYWPDAELARRWSGVSDSIGNHRTFVVQLSAFPTMPTYGVGDYETTTPDEIDGVRFVYTSDGKAREMDAVMLGAWQSRERTDLDRFAWWQVLPFGDELTGEFEEPIADPPLPVGDYYRTWYLVWVDDADDASFQVRVLSKRKERVAKFHAAQRSVSIQ